MDVLLAAIHLAGLAAVLGRLVLAGAGVASSPPGRPAWHMAGLGRPPLVAHGAGVVVLWGGLLSALEAGRVARAATVAGLSGAAIAATGIALLAWALAALRSWRLLPEIATDHELCTTGPYRLVRHPIYLAIDLLALGSVVWVPETPVVLGAGLLALGGDWRARVEERALLAAFGDRYRAYMRRVRRLIPGLY